MTVSIHEDCRFLETHEWARRADGHVRIGLSAFAQDELGDVVFVELPRVGDELTAGEDFAVVESVKAVSDVYAPVSGEVTAVNDALETTPELLNENPYGDGWLVEVTLEEGSDLEDLLSPTEYEDRIA